MDWKVGDMFFWYDDGDNSIYEVTSIYPNVSRNSLLYVSLNEGLSYMASIESVSKHAVKLSEEEVLRWKLER